MGKDQNSISFRKKPNSDHFAGSCEQKANLAELLGIMCLIMRGCFYFWCRIENKHIKKKGKYDDREI